MKKTQKISNNLCFVLKHLPTAFLLMIMLCSVNIYAQQVLFEEKVTGFDFSKDEQNLRTTYDAREIKFVRFRGLEQESIFEVSLFGSIKYQANYIRTDKYTIGSTAWVGKLANQPNSAVIFAEKNGTWAGRIQDESGNRYLLVSTDQSDVYALVELGDDNIDEGNDQAPIIELQNQVATPRNAVGICDVGSTCASKTVDIMIVYTAAVVANHGGEAAVQAEFTSIIADMNLMNTNSLVNHTFNLKATYESDYVETSSSSTDLNWLSADATVLALREAHGADIVGLITNTASNVYCGLGNLNTNPTNYNSNAAFSVSAWGCAGSNRTFAHEVGHNMGLRHDRHVDNGNTPCVEAHGYVNQAAFGSSDVSKRWRTVMAYNNQCSDNGISCSRLGYWSNPNNTNTGDPMGSTTAGSEADAAYLLNRSICMVSEFKAEPICPSVSVVDMTDFICSGGLNAEISDWQNSVNIASNNFAAIESSNTNASVEYSTVLITGGVTSPNGNTASGVHSGAGSSSEIQTTYAYLRCFGADKISGTGDDSYLLLGTHTLNVDISAIGTGDGMTSVMSTSCTSPENISLSTNATTLPENGIVGWWITEDNPISTTVTDNASLTTALNNVTIGGTLSNTVNNLFESTSGSPLKEYTLPFDCSTLSNGKTYYATPVKASSKVGIPDLMCNNLQGNGSQVNFNSGSADGSGATVDFSSCSAPTTSNPVTFSLTINLTAYTETLPSNLTILLRNTANSNLIFTNNSITSLPTVLTYTEADFPAGYDPRTDGLIIYFVNFNSPYSAGNPTIQFNYDLDLTYPGEPAIVFPAITAYDDCLFGTPVQIDCDCPGATCQSTLDVTTVAHNQTYHAANTLTSSIVIPSNNTVTFLAGQSITLEAGFQASPATGFSFTAAIASCALPLQTPAVDRNSNLDGATNLSFYPNPARETVTIDYQLGEVSTTNISLYDITGKKLTDIVQIQSQAKGKYQQQFNISSLRPGMYFVLLQTETEQISKKLILVR